VLVLVEVERRKKRYAASSSSKGVLYYKIYSKLGYNKYTYIKDVAILGN
jgi:hypothetical protein